MIQLLTKSLLASALCMAVSVSAQVIVFSDDMENGVNGWTTYGSSNGWEHDGGLWHQSGLRPYGSSNKSWYYGFENLNTYDVGENVGTLISPEINLAGYTNATLNLKHFLDLEAEPAVEDDYFFLWVFDDLGGCELVISRSSGEASGWENLTVDLTPFAGNKVQLAFEVFTSNSCASNCWSPNSPEGWYVDDVVVTAQ